MFARARPGRPVPGTARPGRQQAQLTGKFGARGLKDPFELEAELKGITPPPRLMDQYMREWKTKQASMRDYRQNGRQSREEQMAYLAAMMKDQYQQDKQTEINILSDKFAKEFMCWLMGDDPANPGDPAYVRDRMQLAGFDVKKPVRMRGEGVDEYLSSFLAKKSEFVKKWTRIRLGPHRAFKWNLGHFYLFYKYFLRNAPYTEDELLSDFDCFYPDLSSARPNQPYRELNHPGEIVLDGTRAKLEPHSAFCGTEAPTNQPTPVTVKTVPHNQHSAGPSSDVKQEQKTGMDDADGDAMQGVQPSATSQTSATGPTITVHSAPLPAVSNATGSGGANLDAQLPKAPVNPAQPPQTQAQSPRAPDDNEEEHRRAVNDLPTKDEIRQHKAGDAMERNRRLREARANRARQTPAPAPPVDIDMTNASQPQQPAAQPAVQQQQQAAPQQAVPQPSAPQQAPPQQAVPQQAAPQPAAPQQAEPQQAPPQQAAPQPPKDSRVEQAKLEAAQRRDAKQRAEDEKEGVARPIKKPRLKAPEFASADKSKIKLISALANEPDELAKRPSNDLSDNIGFLIRRQRVIAQLIQEGKTKDITPNVIETINAAVAKIQTELLRRQALQKLAEDEAAKARAKKNKGKGPATSKK